MSERPAPWWANLPAPEMTRSERARWTDLQVLAYLWVVGSDAYITAREPVTTREVAAALGVSVGRAAHSLRRLYDSYHASRDAAGWYCVFCGVDALRTSCFDFVSRPPISYPSDEAAA